MAEDNVASRGGTTACLRADVRRLGRFGVSGAASTLCYFLLAWMLVATTTMPVYAASFVASLASAAVSFVLHRNFTFQNRDRSRGSMVRFATTSLAANAIAIATPWALCDVAGHHPLVGIAAVCILVPAFNFVLFSLYVFRSPWTHAPGNG